MSLTSQNHQSLFTNLAKIIIAILNFSLLSFLLRTRKLSSSSSQALLKLASTNSHHKLHFSPIKLYYHFGMPVLDTPMTKLQDRSSIVRKSHFLTIVINIIIAHVYLENLVIFIYHLLNILANNHLNCYFLMFGVHPQLCQIWDLNIFL